MNTHNFFTHKPSTCTQMMKALFQVICCCLIFTSAPQLCYADNDSSHHDKTDPNSNPNPLFPSDLADQITQFINQTGSLPAAIQKDPYYDLTSINQQGDTLLKAINDALINANSDNPQINAAGFATNIPNLLKAVYTPCPTQVFVYDKKGNQKMNGNQPELQPNPNLSPSRSYVFCTVKTGQTVNYQGQSYPREINLRYSTMNLISIALSQNVFSPPLSSQNPDDVNYALGLSSTPKDVSNLPQAVIFQQQIEPLLVYGENDTEGTIVQTVDTKPYTSNVQTLVQNIVQLAQQQGIWSDATSGGLKINNNSNDGNDDDNDDDNNG